jgi:hypothetical protein
MCNDLSSAETMGEGKMRKMFVFNMSAVLEFSRHSSPVADGCTRKTNRSSLHCAREN